MYVLKGLCHGCLLHYDNVANYRIYSNKRRSRLSPWEREGLGRCIVSRAPMFIWRVLKSVNTVQLPQDFVHDCRIDLILISSGHLLCTSV